MPLSWGRWLFLLVLFGVAAWAIRRAGDRLRSELGDSARAKEPVLTKPEIDAILAAGLATPETLFAMSAKEQRVLAISATALTKGQRAPPG
jgi:hypothetical protein